MRLERCSKTATRAARFVHLFSAPGGRSDTHHSACCALCCLRSARLSGELVPCGREPCLNIYLGCGVRAMSAPCGSTLERRTCSPAPQREGAPTAPALRPPLCDGPRDVSPRGPPAAPLALGRKTQICEVVLQGPALRTAPLRLPTRHIASWVCASRPGNDADVRSLRDDEPPGGRQERRA